MLRADVIEAGPSFRVEGHALVGDDQNDPFPIVVDHVLPSTSYSYQRHIHYLRSPRADTTFSIGAFEAGQENPLLMMAFSTCDREHLLEPLRQALHADLAGALVMTRAVGVVDLPKNLFSFTLGRLKEALAREGYRGVMLTAFNPYLGFTGKSLLASGFTTYARARVRYCYESDGFYTTGRLATDRSYCSPAATPRNRILATLVNPRSRMRRAWNQARHAFPVTIPDETRDGEDETNLNRSVPSVETLSEYRKILQEGWSLQTSHPAFAMNYRPGAPTGQCGVSSVWLLRELKETRGIDAYYCYGDLTFSNPAITPVRRHCWVEVGKANSPDRLVIDLTADQARGFHKPIVKDSHASLLSSGINYYSRAIRLLDQLPDDTVWPRFVKLLDRVDSNPLRKLT